MMMTTTTIIAMTTTTEMHNIAFQCNVWHCDRLHVFAYFKSREQLYQNYSFICPITVQWLKIKYKLFIKIQSCYIRYKWFINMKYWHMFYKSYSLKWNAGRFHTSYSLKWNTSIFHRKKAKKSKNTNLLIINRNWQLAT